jgi:hypothetical protein
MGATIGPQAVQIPVAHVRAPAGIDTSVQFPLIGGIGLQSGHLILMSGRIESVPV